MLTFDPLICMLALEYDMVHYLVRVLALSMLKDMKFAEVVINPWCMHHRVTVVVQCVYLSVNSLTATYVICKSKVWCSYGVPNV